MVGGVRGLGHGAGWAPLTTAVVADLPAHRHLVAVELLPHEMQRRAVGQEIGPRRLAIGGRQRPRLGVGRVGGIGAGIEQALARGAVGEPGDVIRAVGRDRQAGPVMRAGLDLPVVDADAAHRSWRRGIAEGDHAMIAHRAREDVAEHHGRPAGAGEGQAEPAAFAGVVEGDGRVAEARVAVLPGVGQRRAGIGAAGGARLGDVALVEPGREDAARRIDARDLEALAGRVGRDRTRLREAGAAVARAGEVGAAVEVLVLEGAEGDDQAALGIDDDARPRIGSPVEVHGLGRHRDRRGERLAEVGRALHDDAVDRRAAPPRACRPARRPAWR